jgi:hypothetical protein
MRRNRGASGQQPTSGVVTSPETVFGSGRVLDGRTPKPPHCHSSASFLDPTAISEDEEELVLSQLIPSSPESPQGHASFQPEAQLSPLTHLKSLPKVQSRTSTLEIIPTDGADNRKPNATHITTAVFPSPMRATVTAPDSTPDGSRCDMELSEDLTAQDIDIILGTAPVPVDFSLSRHHLASRGNGENEGQIEETSLWWYHPTFEARAMADIRRSLRALLPSDLSQDLSPIETGCWRAEVRPRRPGVQIWAEPLEDAFGSGPHDRGLGLWPKSSGGTPFLHRRGYPSTSVNPLITLTITSLFAATGRCHGTDADSSHTQNGADTEVVIANSHRFTPPPGLGLPSRNRSPSPEDALTAALTPLVKDKSTLDKTKMVRFIEAPGEVDRANEPGSVARHVVNVSEAQVLGQTFTPTSTPSLGSFLLDIGSNTPRHSQAFPSRRRGTNE